MQKIQKLSLKPLFPSKTDTLNLNLETRSNISRFFSPNLCFVCLGSCCVVIVYTKGCSSDSPAPIGLVMNKKLARTGPRIRITRPARIKVEDEAKYIYTCQFCRVKFTQNSHFFRHMTSNHEIQQKAATFECNDCQIVFSKKANLDLHCQTHHQVKSKSKCESCAITFKSRYCLRRHLKLKQLMQENSCIKCQKKFTSKDGLAKHVLNKHTFKNVMFECDLCSLKFKAPESLRSHLTRVHKRL